MRRRKRKLMVYTVALLVLLGIVGWYFLARSSVVSSPNYMADRVLYTFKSDEGYAFVVVLSEKKMVKIFRAPEYLYDPETRLCLCEDAESASMFFEKVFSFDPDVEFHADLTGERLEEFSRAVLGKSENSLDDLLKDLSKRRSSFLDVLKVSSMARKIRFTRMDKSALYKLLESMSNLAIEKINISGMTNEPLKIKVGDRTILRIYLTDSEKEKISEEFR